MTTPYVDPQTVHNPATGTSPPASWGDTVRDDLQFCSAPPACKAHRTSAQSIATATWTAVTLSSAESWDTDTMHSLATNPSRITVPASFGGRYLICGRITFNTNATGIRSIAAVVNGATMLVGQRLTAVSGYETILTYAEEIALAAGDYVELSGYQSSGGNLDVNEAWMSARFISR